MRRLVESDYLKLLPILGLAFYTALIPRLSYPYPVHVDEWCQLVQSKAILTLGTLPPLAEQSTYSFEVGYNLFWAIFQQVSGIPWLVIFQYFPSVILMMTVLSVYILARREGFGWEAALFSTLIPTTVGILGPAFLVPVAMAMLFIPLSVFLAFNFRSTWSYLVLFIFTGAVVSMHAVTALGLIIILIPYVLIHLRGDFKHSLAVTLALGIPCALPFVLLPDAAIPLVKMLLTPQPVTSYVELPFIIETYGRLPLALCLIGAFALAVRGEKKGYGLALGLLLLLVMLAAFFSLHRGIPILYERGLLYMMLVVAIVAGAGLMVVRKLKLPGRPMTGPKAGWLANNAGNILCLVLIGLTLATVIPERQQTPYYHMIDSEDYQAFEWIAKNVDDRYQMAILDPWKATAFAAITDKGVYTRIHAYPTEKDAEARAFIASGSKDPNFLRSNGIFIVYTRLNDVVYLPDNPDLLEVRENVYLLRESQ